MATFFGIGWYSRRWTNTTAEFYVADGQIPWKLNGVAMFSNYASAASFLGVAGAIALFGIDNWWLALGVDIFGGDSIGLFGRFDDSDRVYGNLRYTF